MSVSFTGPAPNNYPTNTRAVRDANFYETVALPASASTSTNTDAINLEVATPYPTTEIINVGVGCGANSGAAGNNVNITVVLQNTTANTDGTANASNWTNILTLGTSTIVVSSGIAAQTFYYKLPPGCLQFIRAQFKSAADSGNSANSTGFIELLF